MQRQGHDFFARDVFRSTQYCVSERSSDVADLLQRRIEQRVARGRGVEEIQRLQVGVDAVFQREVGDHGACHHAGKVPAGHHLEIAARLVEHQQDQLFRQAYSELIHVIASEPGNAEGPMIRRQLAADSRPGPVEWRRYNE